LSFDAVPGSLGTTGEEVWLTRIGGRQINIERTLFVPLAYVNVPPTLEIVGTAASTIDVRVRGPAAVLIGLKPADIVAALDLKFARAGSRRFHLTSTAVRAPRGVQVSQVSPSEVVVELQDLAKRFVPVVPSLSGEPAPGFVIDRVFSDPATVEIVGPQSRVRQVTGVATEPLSVQGATAPIRDTVAISVLQSSVRLAKPESANVMIRIVPAYEVRQLTDVPIRWRNLAAGLTARLTPSLVTVNVHGSRGAIAALDPGRVTVFIDLARLGAGRYDLRTHFEAINQIEVSSIVPALVTVTIK
jgi:YbbR domain-containing protein